MNNGCGQLGAIQTRGTCWFFSILNGFILSEDGQKILYNRLKNFYKKLKPVERAYFDDGLNAPCPMKDITKTKEIYFWKFIDQYLCFMSGPRALSLQAGKSAEILGAMSLQGTVAKKDQGGKGAFPQAEIGKILDHVGFAKDYYFKYADDPPKFHALRKPQFVIVRQSKYYPRTYMDRIPAGLMADPKYDLMCASLVIANTNANNGEMHRWHAVAGFKCNGTGYIYDSNQRKVFKCNWWNLADFKKVANEEVAGVYSFFKGGQINVHTYGFAIFARKAFTKDTAPACLMKYKTKTPNLHLNFTSPNLGRRINQGHYTGLKEAELVALKRRWAATKHREAVYLNKATFNSILAGAKSRNNGLQQIENLEYAGYTIKNYENYYNFKNKLNEKFSTKKAAPSPSRTYTFAEAKARLNQFTGSTAAVRKHQYSLVWKGIPVSQRRVLMHWRNKGEWPKTPSPVVPSPRAKRAEQVRAEFALLWKGMNSNNRQTVRNYIAAYRSLSPNTKKLAQFFEPAKKPSPQRTLNAAKRNVNALKTQKARKEYRRTRAVNMNPDNWSALDKYIAQKNAEARAARSAKKAAKA